MNRPFPFCNLAAKEKVSPLERLRIGRWNGNGMVSRPNFNHRWGCRYVVVKGKVNDESFPEVLSVFRTFLPVCAWMGNSGMGKEKDGSFFELQKRLGRKNPGPAIQRKEPIRFQAYDLLKVDGEDLRSLPMAERRKRLEDLLAKMPGHLPLVYLP